MLSVASLVRSGVDMNALAGLMNPAAVGGQVTQAFEFGQQKVRQEKARNALAQYAVDPNKAGNFEQLAQYHPQIAIQQRQQRDAAESEKRSQALFRSAMGGDDVAMDELAVHNFDKWKALDATQKAEAQAQATQFGNAALDVLNQPPEMRSQALQGYAGLHPKVAQMAGLPPQQLEAELRSVVAQSKLTEKLIAMERPRYQVIPEGGVMVDTNNKQAVQQFTSGVPNGNQDVMTVDMFTGAVSGLGQQGAAEWVKRNNIAFSVASPEEARKLPSGTRIVLPDGSEGVVP